MRRGSGRFVQFQVRHPNRIEVDVACDLLPSRVVLDEHGAKSPLQQMTITTVPPVKPHAIACVEPVHHAAEVSFRGFQQQVIMVIHQHVSVNPRAETLSRLAQQFQKMKMVGVVAENSLPLVSPGSDNGSARPAVGGAMPVPWSYRTK